MGVGDWMRVRRGMKELVVPVEVEKCGLCNGDPCGRVVPIFGCAFGTLGMAV